MHIQDTFGTPSLVICTRWSSETFTTARPTRGVCALEISALYVVPLDQDGPLKMGFSTKMPVLTIGFLPRNAIDCRLSLWSWKAHLWSTTPWKNQPGPSGNGFVRILPHEKKTYDVCPRISRGLTRSLSESPGLHRSEVITHVDHR